MAFDVRLIGFDDEEIVDLDSWLVHAPPEGGEAQWVDGYSAKEQAKTWLRAGRPAVPAEIAYALGTVGLGGIDQWTCHPEHQTKLDGFGRGRFGWRHHDMLILLGDPAAPSAVVGIEVKACEDYDGTVAAKAATAPPSQLPNRCNLMAQALFGRPVCDAESQEVTDARLGTHGYQLWTSSIGTLREAQRRGADTAVLLVHQFAPAAAGSLPGDKRNWDRKLAENAQQLHAFRTDLGQAPVMSKQTEFISLGTPLEVLAVCSLLAE